jgi:hypothetical protein
MHLRDLVIWPPYVIPEPRSSTSDAALNDTVVLVEHRLTPTEFIVLTLRKTNGSDYRVGLMIPERLITGAIRLIEERKGAITLHQVGILDM